MLGDVLIPTTPADALQCVCATVPPGRWAVGVSGGADSVALLRLLTQHPGLHPHVVHLNHETRGQHSDGDARFVADLANQFSLPCTVAPRSAVEAGMTNLPTNPSARYRQVRFELFGQVIRQYGLAGVILAHHADDQAETVLLRLLRGAGPVGLAGMTVQATVGGITVLRPLLAVRREDLRAYLKSIGQAWREDASNQSDRYARNRIRKFLTGRGQLAESLLRLAEASSVYRSWVARNAPQFAEQFSVAELCDLPDVLARQSARCWLETGGANGDELLPAVLDRLILMCRDAATPLRQQFPGGIVVARKKGALRIDRV